MGVMSRSRRSKVAPEDKLRVVLSVLAAELNYVDQVLAAIRDKVGNRMDILIGTHGQLNTQSAIRFAKVLERYDPLWFEEPVPLENKHAMGLVARSTSVPIATGERLTTKWEFQQILENDAAAISRSTSGSTGSWNRRRSPAWPKRTTPRSHPGPIAVRSPRQRVFSWTPAAQTS